MGFLLPHIALWGQIWGSAAPQKLPPAPSHMLGEPLKENQHPKNVPPRLQHVPAGSRVTTKAFSCPIQHFGMDPMGSTAPQKLNPVFLACPCRVNTTPKAYSHTLSSFQGINSTPKASSCILSSFLGGQHHPKSLLPYLKFILGGSTAPQKLTPLS